MFNKCRKISSDGIIDLLKQAIASLDKIVRQVEVENVEQKIEGLKELQTEEQFYHGKIFLFPFLNIL